MNAPTGVTVYNGAHKIKPGAKIPDHIFKIKGLEKVLNKSGEKFATRKKNGSEKKAADEKARKKIADVRIKKINAEKAALKSAGQDSSQKVNDNKPSGDSEPPLLGNNTNTGAKDK